jgi:hypothetical protein
MSYEDVFFPSLDGVELEGWFIPADSSRLVICNHFMPGNRYGYPGHLEPWTGFGGAGAPFSFGKCFPKVASLLVMHEVFFGYFDRPFSCVHPSTGPFVKLRTGSGRTDEGLTTHRAHG